MSPRQLAAFTAMVAAMYVALVNVQIVGSSFEQIQGGLAASPDQISWVLTAALIAEVIMIPFSGWLTRLLSTRGLLMLCMSGFAIASVGCASAVNIEMMIVFRAMQGFCGGALMPMVFATVYTLFPRRQQTLVMTIVSIAGTSSMAVGPTLGGWLTDMLSWRWMFVVSLPVALGVVVAAALLVDFDRPERDLKRHIDYLGIVLLATCLGSLLIVLEEGQELDWLASDTVLLLILLTVVTGGLFLWRELSCRFPVIDLRAFLDRNFSLGCFYICIFGIVLFVPLFMLPLFLGRVRAIESTQIGTIVSVLGVSMVLSGVLAGVMLRYMRRRTVATIGFSLLAVGTYLQSQLNAELGFAELALPQVIRGVATQMCWLSVATLALYRVPPDKVKNASALFNLTMRLGAATMIAVANTFVQVRTQVHYAHLSDLVAQGSFALQSAYPALTARFAGLYGASPTADQAALQVLSLLTKREAMILAFNEITLWTAILCAASLTLMPLIRGRGGATPTPTTE